MFNHMESAILGTTLNPKRRKGIGMIPTAFQMIGANTSKMIMKLVRATTTGNQVNMLIRSRSNVQRNCDGTLLQRLAGFVRKMEPARLMSMATVQ